MDSENQQSMWTAAQTVNGNAFKVEPTSSGSGVMATQQAATHHHQQTPLQEPHLPDHSNPLMSRPQPPQPQSQQQQLHPQVSHHDSLDRQMIRHLLNRYSPDEISKLMQEESSSPALHGDGASVITSSTFSSIVSEDAPSLLDSSSSIHTGSDDSSKRGSILSNLSGQIASLPVRKSHSSLRTGISDISLESDGGTERSAAAKQKGAFSCGFCREEEIQKTCTRKNDLKRHIEDFHNTNAQWFCNHRGCNMVFDWQTAYKTHLKLAHGGSRMNLDEAKKPLCTQTVFACGFDNCAQVFEAPGDNEAASTFKEYVGHIVKHFDEGSSSAQWSYSTRMNNLLRQSGVLNFWAASSWVDPVRDKLKWQTQSSHVLRKRLETKHIGDAQLLIQYAVGLGNDPPNGHNLQDNFVTPFKSQCQMNVPGHKIQQPVMSTPTMTARDPYQFKISRGPNPELAAYLASQRRVYVPRTPVRTGRSTPAPAHGVSSRRGFQTSPMSSQHSFHSTQSTSSFDTQSQHRHQLIPQMQKPPQQQFQAQHQQPMLMNQMNGDMLVEGSRAFRSIPDESREPDINMGDTQMLDSNFIHQQPAFSTEYGSHIPDVTPGNMLTSQIPLDQSHFGGFDVPHNY